MLTVSPFGHASPAFALAETGVAANAHDAPRRAASASEKCVDTVLVFIAFFWVG
jgi:hypothetical protein